MKFSVVILSSVVFVASIVSTSAQAANMGGHGASQLNYSPTPSPIGMNNNPRVHKIIYNKATGKTYNIIYLPSGRSRILEVGGGEYIYNPRNGELVMIK